MSLSKEIFPLLKWLLKSIDRKGILSLALFILLGFFQGIGIMIIIPILSITGFGSAGNKPDSQLAQNAKSFLNLLHIPISFYSVLTLFLGLIFFTSVLKYFSTIINAELTQKYAFEIRKKLHHSILNTKWKNIINMRSSDLVGLLSREVSQVSYGVSTIIQLIGTIVLLVVNIVIAFFISTQITFYVAISALVLFFLQHKLFSESLKSGKRNMTFLHSLQSNLQELFQNIKLAKSQNLNQSQSDSLDKISSAIYDNQNNYTKVKARNEFSYNMVTAVLICVFLYIVFVLFSKSILDLVLLVYVFSRILPGLKSCSTSIQIILNIIPVLEDIKNKIEMFEKDKENIGNQTLQNITLKQSIELKNVSFQYKQGVPIFKNASLLIPSNKITFITGMSGSGKSTLADLLTGLILPDEGQIFIDNECLLELGYKNWRNNVAYMPQESFLLHDSIRNNLLWSNPAASEEDIWKALEQSNVKNHIMNLEKGIDTVVGDRGTRISGGQRQRIILAMALIRKPTLLILDESTNELDENNEKEIFETIFKLKESMTIVIITHRLLIMKMADNAVLLKGNKFYDWES